MPDRTAFHVAQHLRPSVPRHHLGRKPWRRRSAASSTAARPASASRSPRSRPGSTSAGPASRASSPSAASPTRCKVLSGVMLDEDGETMITTGTPISMLIENVDQRSKDYGEIARQYRPGHADYTYDVKYGMRDYRGGGRSSARETAARVAAGAHGPQGRARAWSCAARWCRSASTRSTAPTGTGISSGRRGKPVLHARSRIRCRSWPTISTASARPAPRSAPSIEIVAEGVPAGLGAPIYAKLDQDIASQPDVDQRRQGRRDRQRLRGRRASPARRMPTRCAWAMTASRSSCPTMPAASSAASRPASRSSRASPSSRPRRS